MNNYPAVGIGILNWNGKRFLEQFLPFYTSITYPNYTIYVIDNDSSDDSLEFLKNHYPEIKIILTGGNLGFAGGYNYGFERMPEPYWLMINSDVEVTANFLEPLVELMESDRSVAVCQPKILSWHNRDQFEHAGAAGGMMDVLGYSFCRGRIFDSVEKDTNQYQNAEVFWASGACSLIRAEAYKRVGGMYPYFFMHFEEIDLCWRFQSWNYKVGYCNQSAVYHIGGGTLTYQSPVKTYYNFRNNLIVVVRNSPWYFSIWWLPVRFCIDQLAAVRFVVQKDFKNVKAIFKAYRGLLIWLFKEKNIFPGKSRSLFVMNAVLKRSIIWQYFINKKSVFSDIV